MIPTEEQAKEIFKQLFGDVNEKLGFSLQVIPTTKGVIVVKWYERSTWSELNQEKKVLLQNGNVYENHKLIGVYNLPITKN